MDSYDQALTDIQAEIVQIIALNGGKASIDNIVNEINVLNLSSRRSGKGEISKIVKSSLTGSTANSKPIFKKDKHSDQWMVADKKVEERVRNKCDRMLSKRKHPPDARETQLRKRR